MCAIGVMSIQRPGCGVLCCNVLRADACRLQYRTALQAALALFLMSDVISHT